MKPMLSLIVLICFYTHPGNAQSSKTPKWLCEKGFWVIQSNIKTPKSATIFFYTNDQELVYKEQITGKRINPERIKTRKRLEAVLSASIVAWEKDGVVKENQQLVMTKQ